MKALFAVSLLALCSGIQLVPIPPRNDGYFMGPSRTNYTVDFFIDHLNPACPEAWTGIMDFWTANSAWLELSVHVFPSSMNTYSFLVSQAGRYIQLEMPDKFTDFCEFMFAHQSTYLVYAKTLDWSGIQHKLATDTVTATGAAYGDVLAALDNSDYNWDVRVSWKYACSREISATPGFLVNGVFVAEATNFKTAKDWATFFSSLN